MLGAHTRLAMALVDSLLKLMSAQGAEMLVIPSTEPPWLDKRGELRTLSMPALGRDMVEAMVEDLLDAPLRAQLAAGQAVETRYAAADGLPYVVLVEPRADGPRLTLRRADLEATTQTSTAEPVELPRPPAESSPAAPPDAPPPPPAIPSPPASADPQPPAAYAVTGPLEALRNEPVLDPGPLASVFVYAAREHASDILLSHGSNARLRVAGEITELPGHAIDEAVLRAFLAPVLGARAQYELRHTGGVDLALRVRTEGRAQRYRANLFLQQSGWAMALRPVRADPPTLDVLNLPGELAELATLSSGLVLMTGTAGSGKSTTLVALIEHINRSAPKHVITLEDPIEYEYQHRRALVHQRQLGVHVSSFSEGLRAALRESPDVILVGEMRDHATMAAALTAAETGHLVLSTLHAADAAMALDRIIDSFPEHQQGQVRFQLSGVLRAVVTQRLLPSRTLPQRVPAIELLRVNTAVATKIREGRGHQIQSEIQKGRADGMLSFEVTLAALVRRGLLSPEAAMAHSGNPVLMAEHLRGR